MYSRDWQEVILEIAALFCPSSDFERDFVRYNSGTVDEMANLHPVIESRNCRSPNMESIAHDWAEAEGEQSEVGVGSEDSDHTRAEAGIGPDYQDTTVVRHADEGTLAGDSSCLASGCVNGEVAKSAMVLTRGVAVEETIRHMSHADQVL